MKIVIAPDSFKESLPAEQVAEAIRTGLQSVQPKLECVCVPIADGGEGTLDAILSSLDGERMQLEVASPMGEPVMAEFGWVPGQQLAVIEMAQASGIELVAADERDPLKASSYGTGELIQAALELGVKRIILSLGGSATNDGGMGMMAALGVCFLDAEGQPLPHGGGQLSKIDRIDPTKMDSRLADVEFVIACDVTNPLVGETGASAVFGPQKGATPAMVAQLDQGLENYADCLKKLSGKAVAGLPGAGAAGGLAAPLLALCQSELKPGIDLVLETVGLADKLTGADWVITGEGRIDGQTAFGKSPVGVSRLAQQQGIPTIALAGSLGEGTETLVKDGIICCLAIQQGPVTLKQAMQRTEQSLIQTASNLAGLLTAKSV